MKVAESVPEAVVAAEGSAVAAKVSVAVLDGKKPLPLAVTLAPAGPDVGVSVNAAGATVRVSVVECVNVPAVPETVYTYVPGAAGVVSDREALKGGVPLAGDSVGVLAPVGGVTESATVCALPLKRVTETLALRPPLVGTVALGGETASPKSKVPVAAVTFTWPLLHVTPPLVT